MSPSPAAHLCNMGWQPSWVRESATSLGGDISLEAPLGRRSSESVSGLSPSMYEPASRPSAASISSALPPPAMCREHSQSGWQPTWVREDSASRASIAEASSGWQPTVLAANFAAACDRPGPTRRGGRAARVLVAPLVDTVAGRFGREGRENLSLRSPRQQTGRRTMLIFEAVCEAGTVPNGPSERRQRDRWLLCR